MQKQQQFGVGEPAINNPLYIWLYMQNCTMCSYCRDTRQHQTDYFRNRTAQRVGSLYSMNSPHSHHNTACNPTFQHVDCTAQCDWWMPVSIRTICIALVTWRTIKLQKMFSTNLLFGMTNLHWRNVRLCCSLNIQFKLRSNSTWQINLRLKKVQCLSSLLGAAKLVRQ